MFFQNIFRDNNTQGGPEDPKVTHLSFKDPFHMKFEFNWLSGFKGEDV